MKIVDHLKGKQCLPNDGLMGPHFLLLNEHYSMGRFNRWTVALDFHKKESSDLRQQELIDRQEKLLETLFHTTAVRPPLEQIKDLQIGNQVD